MREGTIPPNFTDIVQLSSQIVASDHIYLQDTWFTPDLEEDPRKTSSLNLSVAPDNNNKIITSPQSEPHVQEITARKGASASEVHKHPTSEGF